MKVLKKIAGMTPGQIAAKGFRWGASKLLSVFEEIQAHVGGLEIKPTELPRLLETQTLNPEDAAAAIMDNLKRVGGISDQQVGMASELFPDEIESLIEACDRYTENKFRILGIDVDYTDEIKWHFDPAHEHSFDPRQFHSRVRHSRLEGGYDIKYPWELSRLQHLPQLAIAYRLTGKEKYLNALIDQAKDWIQSNPVGFGPNWACTMDVSIRAANLSYAFALAGDAHPEPDFAVDLARNLISHGRFIVNHLEWSDELTSNHYLADIAGLAVLSSFLSPVVKESKNWILFAADELHTEILKQVYPDGWDFEASTAYHRLVMEFFLISFIFLKRAHVQDEHETKDHAQDAHVTGIPIKNDYYSRLSKMAGFLRDIALPDGSFPLIGDNDSGLFMSLQPRDLGNLNYLMALTAVCLDEPHPVPDKLTGTPEIIWLAGSDSLKRPEQLANTDYPELAEYPDGGLWCMRSSDGQDLLTFRIGQVGQNGNGGHAHNDQLSVTIWFDEKPVIVDPGSAVYTSDPVKRNLYRSTRSHATISIGNVEQNQFIDGFLFTLPQKVKTEFIREESIDDTFKIRGILKGYGPWSEDDVRIERMIGHNRNLRQFEIIDKIEAHDKISDEKITWNFPLAPGLTVEAKGSGYLKILDNDGVMVGEMLFLPGWEFKIDRTWFSPEYGVEVPNITLRFNPPGEVVSLSNGEVVSLSNGEVVSLSNDDYSARFIIRATPSEPINRQQL